MQTRTFRDHYKQINVKSTQLLTIKDKQAQLSIHTSKSSNGKLTTTVSIGWPSADGIGLTHTVFEDYFKTVSCSTPARVTVKVAEAQHEQVLQSIADITSAAIAHYQPDPAN